MPHSSFKETYHDTCSGVTKCSCRQTFTFFGSEKDQKTKVWLYRKFFPNPSEESTKIKKCKKFMMFEEKQAVNRETI